MADGIRGMGALSSENLGFGTSWRRNRLNTTGTNNNVAAVAISKPPITLRRNDAEQD